LRRRKRPRCAAVATGPKIVPGDGPAALHNARGNVEYNGRDSLLDVVCVGTVLHVPPALLRR
jgi:hypothetical protein